MMLFDFLTDYSIILSGEKTYYEGPIEYIGEYRPPEKSATKIKYVKTKAALKLEQSARIMEKNFSFKWLERQLFKAERIARKGKTHTKDVYYFELNLIENIRQLTYDIWWGLYKPTPGIRFVVKKPVPREIYAAPFRDRIVHHFLFNMVYPWWDARFINNSYSCRYGKGALYGMEMMRKQIRRASCDYTREAWILKLDIRGFFMSLNHEKLMERVKWGLDRQFVSAPKLKRLLMILWEGVIFTDPKIGVRTRGKLTDWDLLPPSKILANQPVGTGIVIGNLTSQLLSNIFMDQIDRFITFELKYKNYGRYVDDLYIVVPVEQKEQLMRDKNKIVKFFEEKMLLHLNQDKTYFQDVRHGAEFLGFVVRPNYTVVTKRFRNNFFRAMQEVEWGFRSIDSVPSYLGRLKHVNGKKLAYKVFNYIGWDYNF